MTNIGCKGRLHTRRIKIYLVIGRCFHKNGKILSPDKEKSSVKKHPIECGILINFMSDNSHNLFFTTELSVGDFQRNVYITGVSDKTKALTGG